MVDDHPQTSSPLRGKVFYHQGIWAAEQEEVARALYYPASLYEVMRIIRGVPLFVEDHYQRLCKSAAFSKRTVHITQETLSKLIYKLSLRNHISEGNIRLAFPPQGPLNESNLTLSFIPHSYPSAQDYLQGVTLGTLYAERSHPSVKAVQADLKQRVADALRQTSHYEILLVNTKNQITEGSRSNVFFLKDNSFYTAPDDLILPGITRLHILDLMRMKGLIIEMKAIMKRELQEMDACFLAGTSPMILPVATINDIVYPTNLPIIVELMEAYRSEVAFYLKEASLLTDNIDL